jgi:pimeloyl-ACP methyl ester carboxylesterase
VGQLVQEPVVVGASLGGLTGLGAEGGNPGLLRGLVMVDVSIINEPAGSNRIRSFMLDNTDGFASLEEAQAVVVAYAPQRKQPPSIEGLRRSLHMRQDGRWYWRWDARFLDGPSPFSYSEPSLRLAASKVGCPLLLVRGALSDVLSQVGVNALVGAQPRTIVAEVDGMAHMVAGQDNGEFGGALEIFLQSILADLAEGDS